MKVRYILFPWTRWPRMHRQAITPHDVEPAPVPSLEMQVQADEGRNTIVQNIRLAGMALASQQNQAAAAAAQSLME